MGILLFISCAPKHDDSLLHGDWSVQSWIKESTDETIPGKMDMTFSQDGVYEIDYGGETEKGEYWVYGDFLHTVEEGMSEKKVLIVRLQPDTMEIQMNRSGSLERVVLVKE